MSEFFIPQEPDDHTPGQSSADNTQQDSPTSAFQIWPQPHDSEGHEPSVKDSKGVIGGNGGPSTYTPRVSLIRSEIFSPLEDALNGGVIGVINPLGGAALSGHAEVETEQDEVIIADLQNVGETGVLG